MTDEKQPTNGASSAPTCSAVVTRYPTGSFGIDCQGNNFHWFGWGEEEVREQLALLNIPDTRVKWVEKYYDRRYDHNDPRSYKTRKYIPQNAKSDAAHE